MHPSTAVAYLRQCADRAMHARDGRGAAQAERLCGWALGGTANDRRAAAAARRLGEWLRTAGARP